MFFQLSKWHFLVLFGSMVALNVEKVISDEPRAGTFPALATLKGHTGYVNGIACSRDGRLIASCSSDKSVRVWDPFSSDTMVVLTGHESVVSSIAMSEGGPDLISADVDENVIIWDLGKKKPGRILPKVGSKLFLSQDGKILLASNEKQDLTMINLPMDKWDVKREVLLGTHAPSIACSQDGSIVIAAESQVFRQAFQPDHFKVMHTGAQLKSYEVRNTRITCLAMIPSGAKVALGCLDRSVRIWDESRGEEQFALVGHKQEIQSVAFHPSANWLASGGGRHLFHGDPGELIIWCLTQKKAVGFLHGHADSVPCLQFTGDGSMLVSGSRDGTIKVWDTSRLVK